MVQFGLACAPRLAGGQGAQAPLFVVGTARSEFRRRGLCARITLCFHSRRTTQPEVRLMVRALASPRELSKDDDIVVVSERSEGVPLFVEEVTRLFLKRGGQGLPRGDTAGAAAVAGGAARPHGRGARRSPKSARFSGGCSTYALLRDVADLPEAALQASLERLCEAGILIPKGGPPDSAYRFKHALIRDAAYESLLRSRRRTLHLRAAELLRRPYASDPGAGRDRAPHRRGGQGGAGNRGRRRRSDGPGRYPLTGPIAFG